MKNLLRVGSHQNQSCARDILARFDAQASRESARLRRAQGGGQGEAAASAGTAPAPDVVDLAGLSGGQAAAAVGKDGCFAGAANAQHHTRTP